MSRCPVMTRRPRSKKRARRARRHAARESGARGAACGGEYAKAAFDLTLQPCAERHAQRPSRAERVVVERQAVVEEVHEVDLRERFHLESREAVLQRNV